MISKNKSKSETLCGILEHAVFCREELFAPRPTTNLENHPFVGCPRLAAASTRSARTLYKLLYIHAPLLLAVCPCCVLILPPASVSDARCCGEEGAISMTPDAAPTKNRHVPSSNLGRVAAYPGRGFPQSLYLNAAQCLPLFPMFHPYLPTSFDTVHNFWS